MDQNQPELTFEESIKQVMQTLPPVIRTYLSEGKYTPVARSLMTKYNLRIDQGGVLEREIMLLLMGVEDPTEFTQALIEEAKLDQQTVNSIIQDVNDQIFIPLRSEEEKAGGMAEQPAKPTVVAPVTRPQQPLAPHIASLPPKMAMPSRSTGSLGDIVRSVTAPKMLEDHEEPHMELSQAPVPPIVPVVPAAPRIVATAPDNLPGMLRPSEAFGGGGMLPQAAPAPTPFKSQSPSLTPPAAPAPIAPYSSDPYREPVDEPLSEM